MPYRYRSKDRAYAPRGVATRYWSDGTIAAQSQDPGTFRVRDSYCFDAVKPIAFPGDFWVRHAGWYNPWNGVARDPSRSETALFENYFPTEPVYSTPSPIFNWPGGPTFWLPPHLLPLDDARFTASLTPDRVDYYGTLVAARSNPNRPEVSIPVAVGELRELPSQIFERGRKGLSRLRRSDSVGVHYGVLPFVSDFLKLMNVTESVERRTRELQSLHQKGGLRRKIVLYRGIRSEIHKGAILNGFPYQITGNIVDETKNRVWGVARWKASEASLPRVGSVEEAKLARDLVLGVSTKNSLIGNLSDAWNLIPWSWAADWFSNLGDYLEANRNNVPVELDELHVMQHVRTTRTYIPHSKHGMKSKDNFYLLHETKERARTTPTLAAVSGYLSPKQVSILSGIALGRASRKGGRS